MKAEGEKKEAHSKRMEHPLCLNLSERQAERFFAIPLLNRAAAFSLAQLFSSFCCLPKQAARPSLFQQCNLQAARIVFPSSCLS
jgi:hypothetical protein